MERQRSFSLKSTRVLVFSFIISSSLVFISFCSIWVIKATPFTHQGTRSIQFNKVRLNPIIGAHNLTAFSRNFRAGGLKNSVLTDTQIRKPQNASGFAGITVLVGIQEKKNESESESVTNQTAGGNALIADVPSSDSNSSAISTKNERVSGSEKIEVQKKRECDITNGKWVFDESYPLYTSGSCPFIDEGFNCEGNGRLNKDYMKWRWQPHDCDIPRFNATNMLNLIRGKRLVFVGDSINRNQWESMLCLLMGAIKDPKRVYETHRRKITKEKGNYSFRFVDYKCTVEYYVTHFLVHESKSRLGHKRVPTLRIDAIDRGTSRWKGANILVFNSAHWWSHYKTKAGINYYQEGNLLHPHLDVSAAFRRALTTWASWVDRYTSPSRTQVFFRSSAPSHFSGGQWNSGGHCMEATQPINETLNFRYTEKNVIVQDVIKQMRTPVTFLDITHLSEYRIDGHPSVYGRKLGKNNAVDIQDCSHWCLPGVPDTWNELLYFYLKSTQTAGLTE